MVVTQTPGEEISRADLRAAVYAVVHGVLAASTLLIGALADVPVVLVGAVLFAGLAMFNADMIGKRT